MNHHNLSVQRTAHYYTLGTPSEKVRELWIVCHGYAQLASEFLGNFETIQSESRYIVAPEGLNCFYKKGFAGPVGANWMTRHERLSAITDNAGYLQKLYEHCLEILPKDVRVVLLGFSQGTATICRWILQTTPVFHELVLWGGLPPEDIDYTTHKTYLSDKNLYLLYGSQDPFLTPDRMAELQAMEKQHGIDIDESRFEGGHEIPEDALQQFVRKIT
ncbi:MAG: phospholipase [Saprospiraceae bacterium]|nr:phospholipase [Saprospiraceae bacterium]